MKFIKNFWRSPGDLAEIPDEITRVSPSRLRGGKYLKIFPEPHWNWFQNTIAVKFFIG